MDSVVRRMMDHRDQGHAALLELYDLYRNMAEETEDSKLTEQTHARALLKSLGTIAAR
jgi:hypothetical protein